MGTPPGMGSTAPCRAGRTNGAGPAPTCAGPARTCDTRCINVRHLLTYRALPTARAIYVDADVGKSWSKGLTAANDGRVARNAAAHRGMQYRPRAASSPPLGWSAEVAYAVGLMATDGCLVGDGRHLAFTSCDRELVETLLAIFDRRGRYQEARTSAGNAVFRAQFGDVRLYRWLMSIGLTPRKSLTLGAIDVPDEYFLALVRGLLDGDGGVYRRIQRPTRKAYPLYEYDRLWVYFTSASRSHVDWLASRLNEMLGIRGYLYWRRATAQRRDFFQLRFGRRASTCLMTELYRDPAAPRLERKFLIWANYCHKHSPRKLPSPHASLPTAHRLP